MLRLTIGLVGASHVIAAVRAPHQHYLSSGLPNADSKVGYNWGTRDHWRESVALHHEILRTVLSDLRKEFPAARDRTLLAGFSQPVGMNYRFAATYPDEVRGVIGICGGVPGNWESGNYGTIQAALLHISRSEDEFYPVEKAEQFPSRLRERAGDVEFHMLPGGHRFPSKAGPIVRPWMERVFPA